MQFAVSVNPDPAASSATSATPSRFIFLAIAVLAVAGIAVSEVSLERHYAKSKTAFCDFGETPTRLLVAAVAGLGFALYLTYVEAYVLETWCILCLSSLGLIAGITVLAGVVRARAS